MGHQKLGQQILIRPMFFKNVFLKWFVLFTFVKSLNTLIWQELWHCDIKTWISSVKPARTHPGFIYLVASFKTRYQICLIFMIWDRESSNSNASCEIIFLTPNLRTSIRLRPSPGSGHITLITAEGKSGSASGLILSNVSLAFAALYKLLTFLVSVHVNYENFSIIVHPVVQFCAK